MAGPLEEITVVLPEGPLRMLHESMLLGIPSTASILTFLICHPDTAVTANNGERIMYSITVAVRIDVLTAFDSTLETWEDRSEQLLALVHLEDEARDEGTAMVSAHKAPRLDPTTAIDVRMDAHDLAVLCRVLDTNGDDGSLFTALMLGALNGYGGGKVRADDPLLIPA